MLVDNRWSSGLLPEIKALIFNLLNQGEIGTCALVCKMWLDVAEKFLTKFSIEQDARVWECKKIFAYHPNAGFFSFFPLGSNFPSEKIEDLSYVSFNVPRTFSNDMIKPSELPAPITVGRISVISEDKENIRFTFLAIRFINRTSDPKTTKKEVSVWIRFPKNKSWMFFSGTPFPAKDGSGKDFCKTIDKLDDLVKDYINRKKKNIESKINASGIVNRRKAQSETKTVILA